MRKSNSTIIAKSDEHQRYDAFRSATIRFMCILHHITAIVTRNLKKKQPQSTVKRLGGLGNAYQVGEFDAKCHKPTQQHQSISEVLRYIVFELNAMRVCI